MPGQLADDESLTQSISGRKIGQRYSDWKAGVKENHGLNFTVDYSMGLNGATNTLGEEDAFAGGAVSGCVVVETFGSSITDPGRAIRDGDYKLMPMLDAIVHVENDLVTYQQLKFLDSEDEAFSQTMSWTSGATHDTVKITLNGETVTAQISEDKRRISGGPVFGTFDWASARRTIRARISCCMAAAS